MNNVFLIIKSKDKYSYIPLKIYTTLLPPSPKINGKLKAIHQNQYIWNNVKDPSTCRYIRNPVKDPLTGKYRFNKLVIKFLEEPPIDLYRTYASDLEKGIKTKENGLEVILDPLEKKLINTDIREAIEKIVQERYYPLVDSNFKFEFHDHNYIGNSDIRITFNTEKPCYSMIGTFCLKAPQDMETMNFGWFDVGTVLHEFGHALGLDHEHQSPYGNTINWNEEAVYNEYDAKTTEEKALIYDQIIKRYDKSDVSGTVFDPKSIMLYFYPASLTTDGKGTTLNQRLSCYDVLHIHTLYGHVNKMAKTILDPALLDAYYWNTYGEYFDPEILKILYENINISEL